MRWLLALAMAVLPFGALAQSVTRATPDPALIARADGLVAILAGGGDYDAYFASAFRTAVPQTKFSVIAAQLSGTLGKPVKVESLAATSTWSADIVVGYERGTASVRLSVDPAPPHVVSGLLVTGTAMRDDSLAKVEAEFRVLPGTSGFGLYALGDAAPTTITAIGDTATAPLGSAFKLWVLAEAVKQIGSGARHWSDVVPIGRPSLPSGVLQSWPAGAPVTLHTLATLMISISDNTATDTLIGALGRGGVDAQAVAHGGTAPVLTTRAFFALKADPALTAAWRAGDAAVRARLLATNAGRIAGATLDPHVFGDTALAIDSVEWFASPKAMAGLLDTLRHDATARSILGVNPGMDPAMAARFGYVGFKGGSEPGVLALNFVVQAKDGRWYAACANWHRADGAVNELRLLGLVTRALALVIR